MHPVGNITHSVITKLVYDLLSEYKKPKIISGPSASKMEYDDFPEKKEFTISDKQLENIYKTIASQKMDGSVLYSTHKFEIPVQINKYAIRQSRVIQDNANGLVYSIGNPSQEYTLLMADYVFNNLSDLIKGEFFSGYPFIDDINRIGDGVLDFLSHASEVVTIQIFSVKSRNYEKLVKLAVAMSYEIAFSYQAYCSPIFNLREYFSEPPLKTAERKREDASFPKRSYNTSLIQHYSQAMRSGNSISAYLSFYHIVEHFFDAISMDEARRILKDMITRTGFSIESKSHMDEVLRVIRERLTIDNNGTLTGAKESQSLKLVISKFVNLTKLTTRLSDDEKEYYEMHKVPFADTVEINFEDEEEFVNTLSRRVYQTRNAIVHSKEGNQNRYKPSQDRGALTRELPLLKAIAELVIENNSEEADFR